MRIFEVFDAFGNFLGYLVIESPLVGLEIFLGGILFLLMVLNKLSELLYQKEVLIILSLITAAVCIAGYFKFSKKGDTYGVVASILFGLIAIPAFLINIANYDTNDFMRRVNFEVYKGNCRALNMWDKCTEYGTPIYVQFNTNYDTQGQIRISYDTKSVTCDRKLGQTFYSGMLMEVPCIMAKNTEKLCFNFDIQLYDGRHINEDLCKDIDNLR